MNSNYQKIFSKIEIIRIAKTIKSEQRSIIIQIYDDLLKLKNKKINEILSKIKDVYNKEQILNADKKIIIETYDEIKTFIENTSKNSTKTNPSRKTNDDDDDDDDNDNEDEEDENEEDDDEENDDNEENDDDENDDNEENDDDDENEVVVDEKKTKNNKTKKNEKEKITKKLAKEINKKKTISLPVKPKEDKKKILKKTDNLDKYFVEEYDEIYDFLKKELTKIMFEINAREIKINISNFDDMYDNGIFKELNECALKIKKKNNMIVVNATGQAIKEIFDRCKISYSENLFVYEDGEVVNKKKPTKKTDPKKKGTTLDLVVPALTEGTNIKKTKCFMVFSNCKKIKKIMDFKFNKDLYFISYVPIKNKSDGIKYVFVDEDEKSFTNFISTISK